MFRTISTILLAALFVGCANNPQGAFPSSLSTDVTNGPYRLMAGDEVEVKFDQIKEASGVYILDPQGAIHLPVLGTVVLENMTQQEAQQSITEVFSRQYSSGSPLIKIVSFQNSEFVTIIGEVEQPGNYAIENQLSLIKAIGIARGFTDDADMDRVRVIRKSAGGEVVQVNFKKLISRGDYGQDLLLFSDDMVYVPAKRLSATLNIFSPYLPFIQIALLTLVSLNQLR